MLSLRIALRYLFAPKSHRAVNIISVISMAGVAVATMAIVVVLSVFNGFTDLAGAHLSLIDPDIKIVPSSGKIIQAADSIRNVVARRSDVDAAMLSLTERGLLVSGDRQKPVFFRGVEPDKAPDVMDFDNLLIDGIYEDGSNIPGHVTGTQISVGLAMDMGLRPSLYRAAELYVPKRTGRINPANPAASYLMAPLAVTGVFRVDQPEYDSDFMILPLAKVQEMLEYDSVAAGAVELRLARGADADRTAAEIAEALGDGVEVLTRQKQQAETFRMISVEKWVTFLMLIFILLVASFNIISTLSLLVIEKRSNMSTLRALGAPVSLVRNVFIWEGWLITVLGGIAGIVFGVCLSLAQELFGIIKLKGDPSALSVDAYPVRLEWTDVAAVFIAVVATGFLISQISRVFTRKIN